ncbi:hypothetical protein N7508_004274 [Penicillium antarcticum]|uniref:uncharacterized protein n=1 Tax=Penicillium antarcticum TaxID=416450 RepID=UPI0023A6FEC2|nr:uncharacterized protein N7508_004274 [Penicillium antarcticum]KAJ5308895.1 hypothetical protein N7508_004274 [Penicillium antarcticum]
MGTCDDGQFGPIVDRDCRGGFDFTVLFESGMLSVLPAALFLLLASLRLAHLFRQRRKVLSSAFRVVTLSFSATFAAIQIALIVIVAKYRGAGQILLASAVLDLLAALSMTLLLDLEHVRSIRPSFLLSGYLFITVILDLARVRTAWLTPHNGNYSILLSTSLAVKTVLLALASVEKQKWLLSSEKYPSKESVSGPFSRGLFTWLNGLLWRGRSESLAGDDLPNIHEKLLSSELSARFANTWARSDQSGKNALLWAVIKCLRWEIATIAFPRLCVVGFSIAQPFLIGKVVSVLQRSDSFSIDISYGLIGATAILFIGTAVARASYEHLGYRATTMLRGGLMSIVFQHMMDLPLGSTDESSAMSLMGSDIEMLAEYFFSVVCETWANVLQLALATWLLEAQVGAVCIAPLLIVIIFVGASFAMGSAVSTRQKNWLQATEKRINFTSSILGSIRNVKFLGLAEIMGSKIEALRTEELEISKKFRRIQSIRVCMVNIPIIIGQFATLAAYAIVALVRESGPLAVNQAITSLSLITLMITPLSYLLLAIPDTFASIGCLHRIQEFLKNQNRLEKRKLPEPLSTCPTSSSSLSGIELPQFSPLPHSTSENGVVLSLKNVKFGWKSLSTPKIPGIDLTLESSASGNLVIIVGPVGCGKSTFLKGLAGETPVLEGDLFLQYPNLAFCDDTPWLSNSSIWSNIVGEDTFVVFDPAWYQTVVSACGLDLDIQKMPAGGETIVGSKGSKLSGGQRQRIAIARALYARRKIACFDDVLSGLDNSTARTVFQNVFGSTGLLRRLGSTVFLATHSTQYLPQADLIMVLGDNGQVMKQGSYAEIREEVVSFVQRYEVPPTQPDEVEESTDSKALLTVPLTPTLGISKEGGRKKTDLAVYKYYFSALGWARMAALLLFIVTESGTNAFRYVWVDLWSSSSDSNSRLGYWLGIYGAFSVIQALALMLAVFWVWVIIVPLASKNLHSTVLRTSMAAPLFFLSNLETGALVTRFSQDMRLVDMILPRAFFSTVIMFFGAIGEGAIAIASLPYLAAALPPLFGVLYLIQSFYLQTSRQLRLLEIELKSPLYTHFIESLAGLTTIRAFAWTHATSNRMLSILDTAQRPYYLLLCIQRWLALVLNLIVAGMAVLLVGLSVALRSRLDPGLLGVALVVMMDLGRGLSELIQNWTLLETSLGAIARIKAFAEETPHEENDLVIQTHDELSEWPTSGEIEFKDAGIAWNIGDTKPLLNCINLRIGAGQKFGLCGRSGSGKSTLALSLLRLNELVSGRIFIDGQDITLMPRPSIRRRISCLSQESFYFPGTIRDNADPEGKVSSREIVEALNSVGVWSVLTASHSGSEEEVLDSALGDNSLSQGQKQLFCLARALLKRSKILILDEPTSSLDHETDAKVQQVIRDSFKGCTVIMVAHRINTLLDFDQVAVLGSGQIMEVGHPTDLLNAPNGEFSKLLSLGT